MADTMTRNRVTYQECTRPACPFLHLIVDGRQWAEWTHPGQPRACSRDDDPTQHDTPRDAAECYVNTGRTHGDTLECRPARLSPFLQRIADRTVPPAAYGARAYAR